MKRVFIDGSAGTTGLRIRQRLSERRDIALTVLPEELRKDESARRDMLNSVDIAFLCLPDDAARQAVQLIQSPSVTVIDTSTAHRTKDDWAYGMPELPGQRDLIRRSRRIANPGCHASGFIALIAPLTAAGLIGADEALHCFSLTGYSGGGKKMIAEYEAPDRDVLLEAPRIYGLSQAHKHLPEMAKYAGLVSPPAFCPVVAPYYAGMAVTVTLSGAQLKGSPDDIRAVYRAAYPDGLIRYVDSADRNGFISAGAMSGRDDMLVTVCGCGERVQLTALFDNLGKGASGAAIQNMNLVLGLDERLGLNCEGAASV